MECECEPVRTQQLCPRLKGQNYIFSEEVCHLTFEVKGLSEGAYFT